MTGPAAGSTACARTASVFTSRRRRRWRARFTTPATHRRVRRRLRARPPLRPVRRLRRLRRPHPARSRTLARLEAERAAASVVDAALAWLATAAPAVLPLGAPLRSARALRSAGRVPREGRRQRLRRRGGVRRRAGRAAARAGPARDSVERNRHRRSPAITARDSASTASRRTACSPTTRRCACR